jgi:WD40 repeat protein
LTYNTTTSPAKTSIYDGTTQAPGPAVARTPSPSDATNTEKCQPASTPTSGLGSFKLRCSTKSLSGHIASVELVVFSPDGKLFASAGGTSGSAGSFRDLTIKIWSSTDGKLLHTFYHQLKDKVISLVFSPDSQQLAVIGFNNSLKIWEIKTGRLITSFANVPGAFDFWAISPNFKLAASLGRGSNTQLTLWEVATHQPLKTFARGDGFTSALAFSPDSKTLATGTDNTLRLWDTTSFQLKDELKDTKTPEISELIFSPDGKTLVASSRGYLEGVWDLASHQLRLSFRGRFSANSFSPDSRLLALGNQNELELWDLQTGQKMLTLSGHTAPVTSSAFSPDGQFLVSGSEYPEESVRLWDLTAPNAKEKQVLPGQPYNLQKAVISPDGKTVATASSLGVITLWNVTPSQLVAKEQIVLDKPYLDGISALAFNPTSSILAIGDTNCGIKFWELKSSRELARYQLKSCKGLAELAYPPKGGRLAVSELTGSLRLLELNQELPIHEQYLTISPRNLPEMAAPLSFSPDGRFVASSGSADTTTIEVWETQPGAISGATLLKGHSREVLAVAFSEDGKMLASSGADGNLKLWDLQTGKELASFKEQGLITFLKFGSNSKLLISANQAGVIKLWDLAAGSGAGREVSAVSSSELVEAELSGDGALLVTTHSDGSVKLWEMSK